MQAILYSKLLINLNNCVCALANQPLHIEFASAEYRQVLAGAISEGVAVCRAKGISLTRIGRLYPPMMQYALLLPNFIYLRISRGMVAFKGVVYSSMWEDLHRKKPTEIDYLNGEVIRYGLIR
jgi:2-dehydropantoate 2-reductase